MLRLATVWAVLLVIIRTSTLSHRLDDYLLTIDLSSSWNWKTNITETAFNITPVESTGTTPPSLTNGVLFQGSPDDPRIWMYGGTTNWWNVSAPSFQVPQPAAYSLWSYDTVGQQWVRYIEGLQEGIRS